MARQDAIWALGCMSGTSMDGVDAAMVLTDGVEVFEFGRHAFRAFDGTERAVLAAAQGRWQGGAGVDEAARVIEAAHAEVISEFEGVDVVGFHGQTLAHDPDSRRTHQAGDGAALAAATGRKAVWDFRSEDVAKGGQGAPFAPFYHFALAKRLGATEPVVFLNLGGVGNVTYVDPNRPTPEADGAVLAFDTGPASALIDDLVQRRTGERYDENGVLAAAGNISQDVVADFLTHEYFAKPPPKSLDRNDFGDLAGAVEKMNLEDACATLTACSVAAVVAAARHFPSEPDRWLVCGGGRHNSTMMQGLHDGLRGRVEPVEVAGFDGDMLEAQAFAYLAVRVMHGLPTSAAGSTGVVDPVCGGIVSSA